MTGNNIGIATFPYPTLKFDCLKSNLDSKVVRDVESQNWAAMIDEHGNRPQDHYVNDLGTSAIKGIGAKTAEKLADAGVTTVRDFAYANRDAVTALFTGAKAEAVGRLHDAMRVCVGGDVWIQ